jgi:hypothetical protein
MKFIYANQTPQKKLAFKDVEVNQFFVCEGSLYQKVGVTRANQITKDNGEPFSDHHEFDGDDQIERLIPIVKKIEY